MSSTHPLPTYHPTTPPLRQGECVYLISGKLDAEKARGIYSIYSWLTPNEILRDFIINDTEAIAKRKSNGQLVRFTVHMLGYVLSERYSNTVYDSSSSPSISGYDIRWEYKDSNGYHNMFHDEDALVSLADLIILDGAELLEELNHGQRKECK